jgi:hypothetical protein
VVDKDLSSLSVKETEARAAIGRRIVYWALSAVTLLGVAAMGMIAFVSETRFGQVKDVLAILLPMIAAWVGTVLAFYFSKENYVAAAQFNKEVLGLTLEQRLQSISVSSVMIPISTADNKFVLKAPPSGVKLKADLLATTADKTGRNRIVVLDDSGVVKFIAHRSILDKFIAERAFAGEPVADLTFESVLNSPDYKAWIDSFGSVDSRTTLQTVKAIMDSDPKCSDVAVTEDGTRRSRAVGWVTNVIVSEKAKL